MKKYTEMTHIKLTESIYIIDSRLICGDAFGVGFVRMQYGWRVMLWWWHIVIHKQD